MSALVLFVATVAVLLPLLHRDLKRADAKRRRREWLRKNPQAVELARRFNALKVQIGTRMLPAMREVARATQDATRVMAQLQAVMNQQPATTDDANRLADKLGRPAKPTTTEGADL